MAEYSIGEMEERTGLKAHVLRYWEEAVPFIRPRKDGQGRRFYGDRDLELVLRLKHLVQNRKFTLEGAGERLLEELTDPVFLDRRREISEIRQQLEAVLGIARKWKDD
ncbi:MAG: MerR family transcriptional regulator [Spirochaetales bacterium]|nr:MerR family transcriptional regulator [Spirochaetales bacterium]